MKRTVKAPTLAVLVRSTGSHYPDWVVVAPLADVVGVRVERKHKEARLLEGTPMNYRELEIVEGSDVWLSDPIGGAAGLQSIVRNNDYARVSEVRFAVILEEEKTS